MKSLTREPAVKSPRRNGRRGVVSQRSRRSGVMTRAAGAFPHEVKRDRNGLTRCRVCGCTEIDACAGGCQWIEPDLWRCRFCKRSLFTNPEGYHRHIRSHFRPAISAVQDQIECLSRSYKEIDGVIRRPEIVDLVERLRWAKRIISHVVDMDKGYRKTYGN